jgi:putative membrane-bound dehydrogenase-like protein
MQPCRCLAVACVCGTLLLCVPGSPGQKPPTGPATEKRFPPLHLPAGFRATLFACDPLIGYPSAIARGPRPGSLFVAVDYLTGLGTEIVRRDEVRLVEDTDGDGYADKATVFAKGLNSIQGLAYHEGTLYVMHAPYLSALRDTRGKGVADERRDLLTGLGLTPEENPVRLHCANGVEAGHDGWLYLALGDHGCDVRRPEGDRLVLRGGGILRCRPDGRNLHVFATGLRNIYDIALDEELNVFVRDNENDGGDYMVRVCHSIFGADHGYPYLYYEHPDEALPPLADLGRGSSAGGVCYLERHFPPAYRGNLFFCEWGRSVVRYRPRRAGSGFAPLREIEFAHGAANDPYGFKPTDLVVDCDGALFVADWADDQRPRRGRGRIYRVTYTGKGAGPKTVRKLLPNAALKRLLARLDSESHAERIEAQAAIEARGRLGLRALKEALDNERLAVRGRLHAVWILAKAGGRAEVGRLLTMVRRDPDARVQAQAVRAIADLTDPVLTKHRLDAGPAADPVAANLVAFARVDDRRVLLEVMLALGRLRWPGTAEWLGLALPPDDPPLAHAAMQALRRLEDWPAVLLFMDRPGTEPIRAVALRAAAGRAVPALVDGLIERLGREPQAARRVQYADLLTRVHRKPGPWVYWGYRPPPRPPNSVVWERTAAITRALDRALANRDYAVRGAVLESMRREKIPARLATLGRWLRDDHQGERVAAILAALRDRPAGDVRRSLAGVVGDQQHTKANRLTALALFAAGLDSSSEGQLLDLAGAVRDGAVLAAVLRCVGKRPRLRSTALLLRHTRSPSVAVRAAALEALGDLKATEAAGVVQEHLRAREGPIRRAAAYAAGRLAVKAAAPRLVKLVRDPEPTVRRASLEALRRLHESRALSLAAAALNDPETEREALEFIAALGGPEQAAAVADLARRHPAADTLVRVITLLTVWGDDARLPVAGRPALDRAVAEVQGASGVLLRWRAAGPVPPALVPRLLVEVTQGEAVPKPVKAAPPWRTLLAGGPESPLRLAGGQAAGKDGAWLAYTDVAVPRKTAVQFLAGAGGALRVWVNGRPAHRRARPGGFTPDSDRFRATLTKGPNRIVVQVSPVGGPVLLHVRFRPVSSRAEHEKLTQAALARPGDPARGRAVFRDVEKSQCLKCHRLGDRGERIGPDLTGAGGRFSRIYLIESILDPSRTIALSYQTVLVVLADGRQLTGVPVAETAKTLTLADNQGKKHELTKADIEERRPVPQSTMPEGLEKRLTEAEFVDLIAYLAGEKGTRKP